MTKAQSISCPTHTKLGETDARTNLNTHKEYLRSQVSKTSISEPLPAFTTRQSATMHATCSRTLRSLCLRSLKKSPTLSLLLPSLSLLPLSFLSLSPLPLPHQSITSSHPSTSHSATYETQGYAYELSPSQHGLRRRTSRCCRFFCLGACL